MVQSGTCGTQGLGLRLGRGVVDEGVETEEQMKILVEMGCTLFQGYLISRARPASDFIHVLYRNCEAERRSIPAAANE